MQRQKRILYQRLRVPPAVNQFTKTLQNNQSKNLWRLLAKYTPEAKKDKVARLRNAAQNKADGKEADTKKPDEEESADKALPHVSLLLASRTKIKTIWRSFV